MSLLLLFNQALGPAPEELDIKSTQIEANNFDNQIKVNNFDNQIKVNNFDNQIEWKR